MGDIWLLFALVEMELDIWEGHDMIPFKDASVDDSLVRGCGLEGVDGWISHDFCKSSLHQA